ncbi:hypothetical protein AAC387_Pa05g1569 [Persea americana]
MDALHQLHTLVLKCITLNLLSLCSLYMSWYMCLSIFLDSLYLRKRLLGTLILLIHQNFVGSLATLLPLRLPYPECLPFLFASKA